MNTPRSAVRYICTRPPRDTHAENEDPEKFDTRGWLNAKRDQVAPSVQRNEETVTESRTTYRSVLFVDGKFLAWRDVTLVQTSTRYIRRWMLAKLATTALNGFWKHGFRSLLFSSRTWIRHGSLLSCIRWSRFGRFCVFNCANWTVWSVWECANIVLQVEVREIYRYFVPVVDGSWWKKIVFLIFFSVFICFRIFSLRVVRLMYWLDDVLDFYNFLRI